MERRVGQLTGILGFGLVMARLGRLLETGDDLPQWQLILAASAVLGAVVWWLLGQISRNRWVTLGLFSLAGIFLFLRVAVADSLDGGIIPTEETWDALTAELSDAIGWIRSGIPPIRPTDGVVAILAGVFWIVGALYAWGLSGGPVAAMVVPVMVLYLQFAVFDRLDAGFFWLLLSATMIGGALAALGLERKRDAGRARDAEGRPKPRRSLAFSLGMAGAIGVVAIGVATTASGTISEYGYYPWRSGGGGYGPGDGGVYDPFVGMRQTLVNPTGRVEFRAALGDGSPPASQLYWRMETLDEWDGEQWGRSDTSLDGYRPDRPVGTEDNRYLGSTAEVLQLVVIDGLREDLVPTIGIASEIHEIDNALDPRSFDVTRGAAIVYQPRLGAGDRYQILGEYSLHADDLGALATDQATGLLSPIFQAAADAGEFDGVAAAPAGDIDRPADLDRFTILPENTPAAITGTALLHTDGATTDYERAWMLQHWFRESGDFRYDASVTSGNSALVLEDWLTDRTSQNYRTGYCEQFAASMAVLGRALDIPSRVVWGFTPGSVEDGEIVVKDYNAHAWVEMWMDGFGWVRFDPTPRGEFQPEGITTFDPEEFLPEIEGPDAGDDNSLTQPTLPGFVDDAPEDLASGSGQTNWWPLSVIAAIGLVLAIPPLVKSSRRRRRLRRLREGDITVAWDELVDRLTDLGHEVPPDVTPMEYANAADLALVGLASGYSATIYGGRENRGDETHMYAVDGFVEEKYDRFERAKAALNPKSLFRRY